ncbi:uncharacterized protein LOC135226359 [Macrobrachium nipponense]|uniref:uncharacterized protein LOC135226359 n=1 Tax=Macrobrachium nipponense TaxID=159736 RepID=UPI0030C821AF
MKKQKTQRSKAPSNWDQPDNEWRPRNFISPVEKSSPLHAEQDSLSRTFLQDSGGESDGGKHNTCPVCYKWFSRSAALFCHIKQNHRYVLSRPNENSIEELEKQTEEWKRRMKGEDSGSSSSSETRVEATSSDVLKDSRRGSIGTRLKSSESEENCDYDIENYPIIGGSASAGSSTGSLLSFHSASSELLDPDQSFSIVRKDVKKRKRSHEPQSRSAGKKGNLANGVKVEPMNSCTPHSKPVINNAKKNVPKGRSCAKPEHGPNGRLFSRTRITKPVEDVQDFDSFDFSVDNSPNHKKTHQCPICSSWFSSATLLTYHHMRVHMTNEFQQCFKCGMCFYESSLYTAHVNLHEKAAS